MGQHIIALEKQVKENPVPTPTLNVTPTPTVTIAPKDQVDKRANERHPFSEQIDSRQCPEEKRGNLFKKPLCLKR